MPRPSPDPNRKNRCTGNLKTCPPTRGGCGYRYKKTDTKWQDGGKCPECGFDRRCNLDPVKSKTVCHRHGAGSPHKGRPGGRPPKNGRIPEQLAQRILDREQDPFLLEMSSQIAALKLHLEDLVKNKDSGRPQLALKLLKAELVDYFSQLNSLWSNYQKAKSYQSTLTPGQAIAQFEEFLMNSTLKNSLLLTIDRGLDASMSWDEYADYSERVRRIIDSQRKWELDKRYYIAATEAMAMPLTVYRLIQERLPDSDAKSWLLAGLEEEVINKYSPQIIESS